MNKKRIIFIIGIFIVISIIVILIVLFCGKKDDKDAYDIAISGLKIEFNSDIMVYGEELEFREGFEYRRIDAITEEKLSTDEEHGYRAIILYDRNGTISITDEELLLIKEYVEEKAYDMIYIGVNYLDDFERLGFTVRMWDDAYSFEYIGSIHEGKEVQQNEYGNLYAQHGLWTGEDEKTYGDTDDLQYWIVTIMYDYARKAAGVEF